MCFITILMVSWYLILFCLNPDPYSFAWIWIRNEFFHILDPDPDPYNNDRDPPHCWVMRIGIFKQRGKCTGKSDAHFSSLDRGRVEPWTTCFSLAPTCAVWSVFWPARRVGWWNGPPCPAVGSSDPLIGTAGAVAPFPLAPTQFTVMSTQSWSV